MEAASSNPNLAALGLAQLLQAVAAVPELISMMRNQEEQIRGLRQEFKTLRAKGTNGPADPFLDAEGARAYLGNMSRATFDRYRYSPINPLPGHKLDGKVYYKTSEIDRWVILYNVG